jgi:hypothetical protein
MSWVRPIDLAGRFVFLSASFPSGDRAERFPGHGPAEVADATTAIVRGVLTAGGQLVFGGHPTITPLVLLVAGEMRGRPNSPSPPAGDPGAGSEPSIQVFQSDVYRDSVTDETRRLEELGYGRIVWTEAAEGESPRESVRSLRHMREQMLESCQPIAGFFVGGMEGIHEEYQLALDMLGRDFRAFPVHGAGGAAQELAPAGPVPEDVAEILHTSTSYPALVHAALACLDEG